MKLRDDIPEDVREALRPLFQEFEFGISLNKVESCLRRVQDVIRAPEPCQPPIPWEYIDERWQWCAMHHTGEWVWHENRPTRGERYWYPDGIFADAPVVGGCPTHDWKDTLIQRPQGDEA